MNSTAIILDAEVFSKNSPSYRQAWAQTLILAALILILYHRIFVTLAKDLWTDPDYSHGFLVPFFCLWVVWNERERFKNLRPLPNWAGLVVIIGAMGVLILGVLGAENFLSRTSFLFLLAGLVVQFFGWRYFRAGLFPWIVLFLMIPLPVILLNQVTLPLQFLSSRFGSFLLDLIGIPVLREGNLIHLPSLSLDVAEACSGLRSLISLITVSVFYGYFFESKVARRLALVLCAVPIAVTANGFRIMGSGFLGQYWGRDKAEGFFHTFSGIVVFLFSSVLLIILGRVFRWSQRFFHPRVSP